MSNEFIVINMYLLDLIIHGIICNHIDFKMKILFLKK